MKDYIKQLSKCVLFEEITEEQIINILNKIPYKIESHNKGEIIAIEGDDCHSLGIILKGKIEIQKLFPSGQITTINNFKEGNIFGESLIFTDRHTYPATITAIENAKIMYIKKDDIINLSMLNSKILTNFVTVLSHRILMLNDRISNLSQDSIRKKISNFLLTEYKKQGNIVITLSLTRKKMAELLNIPRPSLSRELVKMKEEKIIDFDKNTISILNIDLLEESMLQ
ncbi:Crp/Fnr family transcriptional regulator [Schnuerera sp. xch1]|uniref:Crp/Fnr family transcriptional regulator n=1 Tax=Schnuerera sp. xch1 TaxID=2874283 RepID=UPI001CBB3F0E|nr:Crp/Fnr family transcriptional regulator [Schnuerera sp. xch1]MBZ2175284.1 Crp/Fnr family transcriptional regulator [Schnuerera sp. xch1]